jgi:hypothetical protein
MHVVAQWDLDGIPLPRDWKADYGVSNWQEAYKAKNKSGKGCRLRGNIQKMITDDITEFERSKS